MLHKLLKTEKFIPSEFHATFFDINFDKLYQKGLRVILTDLDNTLITYEELIPTKKIMNKLDSLRKIGFEVFIISNNHPPRIETFLKGTDYLGIGAARKPLKKGIKKALKLSDKEYFLDEIVIIGDQLMTDIYGANRFGAYSILVNPIKRKTEKWYTRLNRKIEVKMLEKIAKKNKKEYNELNLSKRV
jgi:HAD superfamily phosphatase (TIGR01668 family)